jgi:hypothetical protein
LVVTVGETVILAVVAVEFVQANVPVQPVAVKVILVPLQMVELVAELTVGVTTLVTVTGKETLDAEQPDDVHVAT